MIFINAVDIYQAVFLFKGYQWQITLVRIALNEHRDWFGTSEFLLSFKQLKEVL